MATLARTNEANLMTFGQFGNAFLDTDAGTLVPPLGMVIVAIQCLDTTTFDLLCAEDNDRWINTISASHDTAVDAVSGSGAATNSRFIDMDGAVVSSRVGQGAWTNTGTFMGIVLSVGKDSSGASDASFLELDRPVTVSNSDVIRFGSASQGGLGLVLDTTNEFEAGMTIYGRWTAVSLAGAQTGGIICYFGPSDSDTYYRKQ
tara:strand:+ start:337 stop:945 length:609 start_codon:yes stop_codon:yes gene_type:complete